MRKVIIDKKMESSGNRRRVMIPRRDFFKYLGGGIVVLVAGCKTKPAEEARGQERRSVPKDYNAFVHVSEDGTVTCFTGKIEMGQGPITALRQEMADEMDVPFENVKMVMGDTDLCPWDDGTWGSTSVREYGQTMRQAAAEARSILFILASERLKVPVDQLEVTKGVIFVKNNPDKKASYAQLTEGKKIKREVTGNPAMKGASDFKIITKPFKRTDSLEKVTGEAKYAGDFKMPGMLHARILRPPSYGAKLVSADTSEAEKIKGIQVVRDNDFIAVLHEDRDMADAAIVKVKAEFSSDEIKVNDKSVYDHYFKSGTKGAVVNKSGDITEGRKSAHRVIESEFHHAYVAHATIETHAAFAMKDGDRIKVWASAQTPFLTQETIAAQLNMPLDKIHVIVPYVGGGFGGKGDNPQAVEAARITKLTGKSVMVEYTREEEFLYDTTRPAALIKLASGIDKSGRITFWDYNAYYCGDRGADTIYKVPHQLTTVYEELENEPPVHPFATGPWRAPGNSNNTFAREMQMTLMASMAGIDQLDFRFKNLTDEKMIAVLKAAAGKFGYKPEKPRSGRGFGIACGTDVDTWVALFAEVKVDKATGKVQVVRVACAQDMGLCVNPQGSTLQIEGCITMGLGYSLAEEIRFEGGKKLNTNYDTYELPRFSWVPAIETVILNHPEQPPHGGGEPAIIAIGGAFAAGIYDATGAVLYDMPMTPAKVLDALKKV